jgi:hypothetical protein
MKPAPPSHLVRDWFGPGFAALHPQMQRLHLHGGRLRGGVDVMIPSGLAGVVGRRLARQLSVPVEPGHHLLEVSISHQADGLHWDRCFDRRTDMKSVFQPVGSLPDGHWLERTGPLHLRLTVDTPDGGWHWRCIGLRWRGLPLPVWLFPQSRASKRIENGRYRFEVGFAIPGLGTVLSYGGLLDVVLTEPADASADTCLP